MTVRLSLTALVLLVSCVVPSGNSTLPIDAPVGLRLSPLQVASGPARLFFVGDTGTGLPPQAEVAAGMLLRHTDQGAHALVLLGDNFYPDGVASVADPQWDSAFRGIYAPADFATPFYAVAGNHDYHINPQAEYDYQDPEGRWILDSPAEVLPIEVAGTLVAELFLVDSQQIDQETAQGQAVVAWTRARVAASTAPWRFLALHHPPVSHGVHGGNQAVARAFEAEFEGGFQAVFAGHDHDLELTRLGGVDFVVSGAGSQLREVADVGQAFASSTLGYVEAEITSTSLALRFRGVDGQVLWETERTLP